MPMSSEQQPQKRAFPAAEQSDISGDREKLKLRFSAEEQTAIVNRALHLQEHGMTRDDLIVTFEQAGMRRDAIEQAIAEHEEQQHARPMPKPRNPVVTVLLVVLMLAALMGVAIVAVFLYEWVAQFEQIRREVGG